MRKNPEDPAAKIVAVTPDGRPTDAVTRLVRGGAGRILWLDPHLRARGLADDALETLAVSRILIDGCPISRRANYVPLVLSGIVPETVAGALAEPADWLDVVEPG